MTDKQSYFVGTNTTPHHVEEALRQGIIGSDERLLGIFDGIFFDAANARVGGLALNDFLVITDHRLTTWARDQFKDYVDHFPLSHVFVTGQKNKDSLHGTLTFELALPDVQEREVAESEKISLTFDFVPVLDLSLAHDLIEVMGNLNRDMIAGGAGERDRVRAASVLFEKVFVSRASGAKGNRAPAASSRRQASSSEPIYEIVEGDALDDMMTPLHRLDSLDDFGRGVSSRRQATPPPASRRVPLPVEPAATQYGEESRLWLESNGINEPAASYASPKQSRFRNAVNNVSSRVDAEVNPNGVEKPRSAPKPPGVRLREDVAVGGPEGLYTIGRAGRAAWDGLEKLRREAESRSSGVLPMLQNMRDSGMNLHDMTEFLLALNTLLDTLGSSPAAFELARSFLNRQMGQTAAPAPAPSRPAKKPISVEEALEDDENGKTDDLSIPTAAEGERSVSPGTVLGGLFKRKQAINLRVERRAAPIVPEPEPIEPEQPRHRLTVRGKSNSDGNGAADSGGTLADDSDNDNIMMLFSKVDAPPQDGFEGLPDFEASKSKEDAPIFEPPQEAPRRRTLKVGAPSGPELN